MNYTDYIEKAEIMLNIPSTCEKLNNNPLNSQTYYFRNHVKNLLPTEIYKKLIINNPSLPYFYGIPKLHKHNIPLRPIISSTNDKFCKLIKQIAREINFPIIGNNF